MELNESQRRAVLHFGKPLLIVAGAGSGKTRTLVAKVEHLLKEKGLKPDEILFITFTNKAAREIKERTRNVLGKELQWSGTFHSIALKILKKEAKRAGIEPDFGIADEGDSLRIIKETAKRLKLDKDPEEIKAVISKAKENLTPPPAWVQVLLEEYQETLRKNKLLDFSDLLRELYKLLLDEEIREKYRKKFRYILVDEYQDTNTIQYEIVKLLSDGNVCVVGDPNQCIYEWRDARPDNVLRFIEDFKPDIIKLETNYRSKEPILRVANAILERSKLGWKELIPKLRGVRGEGSPPVVRRFGDEEEEALWVANQIKNLLNTYEPKDIAILVRTAYITDIYERTLLKSGIPYRVVGTLRFYERAEIKNLLAVMRLVQNPSDELAFRRATDFFVKGFGEKSFKVLKENFSDNWLKTASRYLKKLPSARSLYNFLKAIAPLYKEPHKYPKKLEEFINRIDYESLLKEKFKKDYEERIENVREFIKTLKDFHRQAYTLEDVLSEVMLTASEEEKRNAVSIMTIHASKGLEFPVVFLPRLEEGILPHHKSMNEERTLEEERRLLYVGITRAKDLLYMTYTKKEKRKPSRFLSDIPKSFLDLSAFIKKRKTKYEEILRPNPDVREGVRVRHKVFGTGIVLKVEGERAVVRFKDHEKVIHTSFLEVLD